MTTDTHNNAQIRDGTVETVVVPERVVRDQIAREIEAQMVTVQDSHDLGINNGLRIAMQIARGSHV